VALDRIGPDQGTVTTPTRLGGLERGYGGYGAEVAKRLEPVRPVSYHLTGTSDQNIDGRPAR